MLRGRRYGALSLDDVARAANVAKTTIYRRWPSKAALVADVLRGEIASAEEVTRGELAPVVASLIAEAQENEETRETVRNLIAPWRDQIPDAEWVRLLIG